MIRIAIVEDDVDDRQYLQILLQRYSIENQTSFVLDEYENGDSLLKAEAIDYDIIFMDIELGEINGIQAAAEIRQRDKKVLIVFTTRLMKYAIQGYSVQATDYILKPLQYEKLKLEMDALCRMIKSKKKFIIIPTKKGLKKYTISQIYYVEVLGHHLYIHSKEGKEEVSGTLKKMEAELQMYDFVKCNKCYLVNLEYVNGISEDMINVDGNMLKMSRREKRNFIQQLTHYGRG